MVIQMMKETLMAADISMPDDAREVVFTSPLEIKNLGSQVEDQSTGAKKQRKPIPPPSTLGKFEDLSAETEHIKKQLKETSEPETGANLLK